MTVINQVFVVDAPLEVAWRHLSRVERWPSWARHIRKIELEPAGELNSGSVGQPRNRHLGAHWAIFDTVDRSLQFHQEAYDSSVLVRECQQRHPELPYLADVLLRT